MNAPPHPCIIVISNTPLSVVISSLTSTLSEVDGLQYTYERYVDDPCNIEAMFEGKTLETHKFVLEYARCMTNLQVKANYMEGDESVVVSFSRQKGDRLTNVWMYRYILSKIKADLLWETRKSYLELYEGCANADGHIAKYLFNIYAGRHICTFDDETTKVLHT
jgi:hypothetical protein